MSTYNGWANYETWNVSLYISNTESLYWTAREYAMSVRDKETAGKWRSYLDECGVSMFVTPDGVAWSDPKLDHDELDEFIQELGD